MPNSSNDRIVWTCICQQSAYFKYSSTIWGRTELNYGFYLVVVGMINDFLKNRTVVEYHLQHHLMYIYIWPSNTTILQWHSSNNVRSNFTTNLRIQLLEVVNFLEKKIGNFLGSAIWDCFPQNNNCYIKWFLRNNK